MARAFKTDGLGYAAETEGTHILDAIENDGLWFVTVSVGVSAALPKRSLGSADLEIGWSCILDETELDDA